MPDYLDLQAAACAIARQIVEVLSLLDDALQIGEPTGERWLETEPNNHEGQLRQGRSDAAEELYQKALNVAKERHATAG